MAGQSEASKKISEFKEIQQGNKELQIKRANAKKGKKPGSFLGNLFRGLTDALDPISTFLAKKIYK